MLSSAGADIDEGIPALHGWGRLASALTDCSGVVPTVVIVDGPAVSGPALLHRARRLHGDDATQLRVRQRAAMVERVHRRGHRQRRARRRRRATPATPAWPAWSCADLDAAIETVENLLAYLPDNDEEPRAWPTDDPADRPCPEAGELIPPTSTGSYDVRKVAAAIVDDGCLLELRDRWAANVVTAFATIGGRPVGIVANQPMLLAGTLDIPASQKAARFVAFCDAFNLPIITLVDTPGFYPGKDLEWRGMIRHGAQLVFAYARATVPRICVDPAQELRRRVHRDGLQDDGQRPVPRLAVGRAGRDGRGSGGGDPAAPGHARGARRVRARLRRSGC